MTKVGSMQSNDLLIEYSKNRNTFQVVNTVKVLEDKYVSETIKEILEQMNIDVKKLRIFFCGANEWVIRARGNAMIEALKEGGVYYGK